MSPWSLLRQGTEHTRPDRPPGWMGVGGAELALQVSAAMDETSKAARAAQSSPSDPPDLAPYHARPTPSLRPPLPSLPMKDTGREVKTRVGSEEREKRKLQVCCLLAQAQPTHPPATSQLLCLQNFSIHSNTVMYRCLNVLLHDTLVS